MDLAASKGVALQDDTPTRNRLLERLSTLQGQEFDREYVKAMVKDHKAQMASAKK